MSTRAHGVVICCIVLAAFAAVNTLPTQGAIAGAEGLSRYEFTEPHMGTLVRIVLYAPEEAVAKKASRAAFARIAELNKILSDYLAESELMQLCKKAGSEQGTSVSPDLYHVLAAADEMSRLSAGAFDATVGPLTKMWRRIRRNRELPTPAELKKALATVGYRNLQLDPHGRTVRLLVRGMLLDLGGIAKGYAADMALAVLRAHGVSRALVVAGGDVVAGDPPPGKKGWKVAVDTPAVKETTNLLLSVANAAVSTAGDANQFVTIGGKRYSHIVDPRTGLGIVGRRSVTVIAPRGIVADGFDTTAYLLGKDQGMKLIESRPDLACLYVDEADDGQLVVTRSRRFDAFLVNESKGP